MTTQYPTQIKTLRADYLTGAFLFSYENELAVKPRGDYFFALANAAAKAPPIALLDDESSRRG